MKVTTNIREYIKAEVDKVLSAKVNPYMEQAIRDRQMIDEFVEEVNAVQKQMVNKFIAENELLDDWKDKRTPFIANISSPSFYHAVTPAMLKGREWEAEQNNYRVSKTREIIAKLELGANRQELEDMLAELLKDA